jgi:hypothetical protein
VSENRVLRGIFGTERGECQEKEGNCTVSSFTICVLQTAQTVSGQLSWTEHVGVNENCTQNFSREVTVFTETQYLNEHRALADHKTWWEDFMITVMNFGICKEERIFLTN